MQRPDVVLLVLDTQRADRMSCYGHPLETSPQVDAFAQDATRFSHAVAPGQWTVPSHASMFTGLYPSQHTTFQMDSRLPAGIHTLAERLQQAGYFTAGFSHNPLIGIVPNGLRRGFQSFSNYDYLGAGLLTVHLSRPVPAKMTANRLRRTARFLLAEVLGYSQTTVLNRLAPLMLPFWKGILGLRGETKQAQAFKSLSAASQLLIKRPNVTRGQPIFTFINLMGTHVPYDPAGWAIKRSMAAQLGGRSASVLLQRINNLQVDVRNWLGMNLPVEEFRAALEAFYTAEVMTQDAQVGKFINDLRSGGVLDDTLLIIVADHGDHLGEKGRVNHTFGAYEQLTHIPLLIRDPSDALRRGTVVSSFVSTRRVFHTALAAGQLASPSETRLALTSAAGDESRDADEGVAFAEAPPLQWAIERIEKRRPGVVQAHGYHEMVRAVYEGELKLIVSGRERAELYAVRNDPEEKIDLRQELPEKVQALRERLGEFVREAQPLADTETHHTDDPAVMERLRLLGYLD